MITKQVRSENITIVQYIFDINNKLELFNSKTYIRAIK